jgi:hypothetical protein
MQAFPTPKEGEFAVKRLRAKEIQTGSAKWPPTAVEEEPTGLIKMRSCGVKTPSRGMRHGIAVQRRRSSASAATNDGRDGATQVTMARAKPSQPFAPTVWIAVAFNRGSRAMISNMRRTPTTSELVLAASTT